MILGHKWYVWIWIIFVTWICISYFIYEGLPRIKSWWISGDHPDGCCCRYCGGEGIPEDITSCDDIDGIKCPPKGKNDLEADNFFYSPYNMVGKIYANMVWHQKDTNEKKS